MESSANEKLSGLNVSGSFDTSNVLVIEDELLMSTLLLRYLEGASRAHGLGEVRPRVMTSGWDLLKKDLSHVQVAVVDILLPQVTGVDLIRDLRHRFPQMGIVPISGMATGPMKRALRESLPTGFDLIEKPIRKEQFVEAFVKAWMFHLQKPEAALIKALPASPAAIEEMWTVGVTNPGLEMPVVQRRHKRKAAA